MNNQKIKLIILNSLYSLFAVTMLVFTIFSTIVYKNSLGNAIIVIIVFLLTAITVLGLWLAIMDKTTKAGLIILRVQSILKYVFIVIMCIAMMLFIFFIQDCVNSCANAITKQEPKEISPMERLRVSYIFIVIIVYATSYMIFYNIMLAIVKKEKPNKGLMLVYVIHNIVLIIAAVVLSVMNIIKKDGVITELMNKILINNTVAMNSIGYIIVIIMLICYLGSLGFGSYILLEKTFKKRDIKA